MRRRRLGDARLRDGVVQRCPDDLLAHMMPPLDTASSTPMLALTQHLFSGALHQLGEGADSIEVAKIIARMNGTSWD